MKNYVIGDIHGRLESLVQVLKKSKFRKTKDKLIILGDIVDGGDKTKEVIDLLLTIKHKVYIIGNHDLWFINYIKGADALNIWIHQGGHRTLLSYGGQRLGGDDSVTEDSYYTDVLVPVTHQEFFNSGVFHYIDEERNYLYVHGGYDDILGIDLTSKHMKLWDRTIIKKARKGVVGRFDKVFIGHSTTQLIDGGVFPIKLNNLWLLDTGAGWDGKLTIMNVDTEEYWQSDLQKPIRW